MKFTTFVVAICTLGTLIVLVFQTHISQNQFINENRSWLCIKSGVHEELSEGKSLKAEITLINAGKSPARDVRLKYTIGLRSQPVPNPMTMGAYLDNEPSVGVVAPESEPKFFPGKEGYMLTKQDVALLSQRKIKLYTWGTIDYVDIFDKQRHTEFCLVNKLGTTTFQFCHDNNTAF